MYVLTSRRRAGGENEGDAAFIRNIYAGRLAREHVLFCCMRPCLPPLDHAPQHARRRRNFALNAIKIDDLNK